MKESHTIKKDKSQVLALNKTRLDEKNKTNSSEVVLNRAQTQKLNPNDAMIFKNGKSEKFLF